MTTHLSFYCLEKIFRERHGVEIPRSQMVQWVEQIAWLLKPLYEVMWREMKAGGYVQVDETPVKVLDPEVEGKAAQGYLWFFSVPGGDVILEFSRSRGQEVPRQRLQGFEGTIQTGWYAFRRGLSTNLYRLGMRPEEACLVLRNSPVVRKHYLRLEQEGIRIDAMARLEQAFNECATGVQQIV